MIGNDDFVPVVLGTGLNAYNIARSLRESFGVNSLALGRFPLRETAHSSIVQVRASADFDDPAVVLHALNEVADENPGRRLLLFPTIESYTAMVLGHGDELCDRYLVPLTGADVADRLMNKTDFYRTCAELSVPHPESVVIEPASDAAVPSTLPFDYPVILKPADTDTYPHISFPGKQKIYLVRDRSALVSIVSTIFGASYHGDLIIQEYLAGDESVMQVANSYSDAEGVTRAVSTGQVVLTEYNPALIGNNNAIISTNDEPLVRSIRTFLDGIGYVGFANFDVMRDRRTGVSKLLEVNLRLGATAYYATAAGRNLVATAVRDLVYDRRETFASAQDEILWVNVPYPVALLHTPKPLRARLRAAAHRRTVHTLDYRPDRSPARRIDIARVDARHTLDHVKYAKHRPR